MSGNPTDSQWLWISAFAAHLGKMPKTQRDEAILKHRVEHPDDNPLLEIAIHYHDQSPALDRDRSGETIDSYKLMKRMGYGGMGEVYLAEEKSNGKPIRHVALKLIRWPLALSKDEKQRKIDRFEEEVQKLAKIESEHIVTLYKAGTYTEDATGEKFPYLVMRYVEQAQSLIDYVAQANLNPIEKLKLFAKVCDGVKQLHSKDLIHCDLKPANILVDSDGHPRVADFGLVKLLGDFTERGPFGMAEGSPAYMSPEQVSNNFGDITKKTDVYALGLILFEMLVGKLPYDITKFDLDVEKWETLLQNTITIATPKELPKQLSAQLPGLQDCISKALAKSHTDRSNFEAFRLEIGRIVNEENNGKITVRPTNYTGNLNRIYSSLGEKFVGRDTFLDRVRSAFQDSRKIHNGQTQWQVITALGGVGKTRTAAEYGWRFADQYTSLLFVRGHDVSRLIGDLADLAGPQFLNLQLDPAILPGEKAGRVLDHLCQNPGWLLIIDNVDDQKAAKRIHQFLANLSGGDVLITSRWRDWNPMQFNEHKLGLLELDAAADLIMLTANKRPEKESDRDDALGLAEDLGRLSLALHQAVAYINASPNVTIAEYRKRWNEQAKELAGYIRLGIYNTDEGGELLTILTTWHTSISQLSVSARWWINHLAFLAPAPVPESLADALHSLDPNPGKIDWNGPGSPVTELLNYSLLERTGADTESIGQMHRLVQMVIRETLKPDKQTTTRLATALKQAFSGDPDEHTNWPRLNPLADHVAALLEPFDDKKIAQTPADQLDPAGVFGFLGSQCGVMLYGQARYAAAETMFRLALAIDEKSFGTEHPNVAIRLNNLAGLLAVTNRMDEAEPMFRRALAIDEKSFGTEHPKVAIRLNNLAGLLRATNRMDEAEPMFRRALAIDEKSFGTEHPNVATDLNNLAELLKATNRLDEAEPMYRRALAIDEKSFGTEHPILARDLNNLAGLLYATNRMDEAEPMYRRALAVYENSFGTEHPIVATGLNNLAGLLRAANRLDEAEPMFRRALAINEKSFGTEHPKVAINLNNLAILLRATNRMDEAEPMFRRALAIDEKSFGTEHPNVAKGLNNLAGLLRDTNRLDEAEPMFRRALAIDEKSVGTEHPEVATDLNNLAELLLDTNRLDEAEPMYRRALAIDEKSFGTEHPTVAIRLNNLAGLLRATNRLDKAEPMFRRSAKIFIKSLGPEHPNSMTVVRNYLILLQKRGYEPGWVIAELKSFCAETGTPIEKLLSLLG